MTAESRARGCLLGLATGDAVGTTLEFALRGEFEPIGDMVGGGPFGLEPGQWTDDTSMALCLAASLLEMGFDPRDQMERYVRWSTEGYMSSTGNCFDIGGTVSGALYRYAQSGDPMSGSSHPRSAGNGSIMRLAPVVLFAYPDGQAIDKLSAESSRTTHAADEAVAACRVLGAIISCALGGATKDDVLCAAEGLGTLPERISDIANGAYRDKKLSDIAGTGYVVQSLEAALWCFNKTDSFRAAVLAAANLGDDADTTAAVCGQVAGAFYGEGGIPPDWLARLYMRDGIAEMAESLLVCRPAT